ncbi:MAG: hypothetical protein DA329_09345 [Candidatus Nitrosocosmicus sp.]|nr:hypothetical protein [Candidatus Nitrosocosmicus sp.]
MIKYNYNNVKNSKEKLKLYCRTYDNNVGGLIRFYSILTLLFGSIVVISVDNFYAVFSLEFENSKLKVVYPDSWFVQSPQENYGYDVSFEAVDGNAFVGYAIYYGYDSFTKFLDEQIKSLEETFSNLEKSSLIKNEPGWYGFTYSIYENEIESTGYFGAQQLSKDIILVTDFVSTPSSFDSRWNEFIKFKPTVFTKTNDDSSNSMYDKILEEEKQKHAEITNKIEHCGKMNIIENMRINPPTSSYWDSYCEVWRYR